MKKELFVALVTGDFGMIQILHEQNSRALLDVTFHGDTPLHIAAREGHLSIVEWILQEKPPLVRARNKDDNTPLHEAAKCGNPDLVKILLQHRKSSAYFPNKLGETALVIASYYGHVATVKLLWAAKEYTDEFESRLSLRIAAYRGYTDIVKVILGNPTKPRLCLFRRILFAAVGKATSDSIENRGATPYLIEAVHGGHLKIVEAMLNSPAWKDYLLTKEDKYGMCAIHVAAMKGRWDMINEFLWRWPDCLEIRSSDHKSVLHFAVKYNKFDIVRNLLLNKSSQKVVELVSCDHDISHNTALHFAAKSGVDPQLVEYLVSFPGVHVNAVNKEDMTALDIASAAAKDNPNCAIIQQKLEDAGGTRFSFTRTSNTTSDPSNANDSKQGEDKDIANTHIVVASLIAAVTFAAMFQIPGGIEDDDKKSIHYGVAKMAFHKLFKYFIISDIAAFISSFTVVVAWLLRQPHFGRTSELSHPSVVILLFSILGTTVAFLSCTLIVTIPSNYENLKSTHKEAFSKYGTLLGIETSLVITLAFWVALPLLSLAFRPSTGLRDIGVSKFIVYFEFGTFLCFLFALVL